MRLRGKLGFSRLRGKTLVLALLIIELARRRDDTRDMPRFKKPTERGHPSYGMDVTRYLYSKRKKGKATLNSSEMP
jgi:hypothetical protein